MSQIIVTFSPNGDTKIDAEGFTGKSCTDATKFLREGLGNALSEERKSEFYHEEEELQRKVNFNHE